MSSVRVRTCAAGAALAVLAGALVDHGAVFGSGFTATAALGALAGGVLGLVPDRSAVQRAGAFVAGALAAWAGYLVRAGALPDTELGSALAVVLVLSLITAVATATASRLPLWAGLLGAGTLVGAYEVTFVGDPTSVTSTSTVAATSVLLAAAAAFVVAVVVPLLSTSSGPRPVQPVEQEEDVLSLVELTDRDAGLTEHDAAVPPVPGPRVDTDATNPSETSR